MNIQQYVDDFDYQLMNRALDITSSLQQRKPKLKVSKVPEDLRTFHVILNIPVYEEGNLICFIKHRFQWNLSDQHISPKEYVAGICEKLEIPKDQQKTIERDLIFQLIDYVERHSYEFEEPDPIENRGPEKRKPGRPVKSKMQPQVQAPPPKQTARLSMRNNHTCLNCQFLNTQSGYECKRCRLPYVLLEQLALQDPIVLACLNLYELTLQKVGTLAFSARNRKLIREDFTSLYVLRDRLKEAIPEDEHLTVDQIMIQIIKNRGPLPIERTNVLQRRQRTRRNDSESESDDK